jgi:tetratricopeptide (TPR) repeat protein
LRIGFAMLAIITAAGSSSTAADLSDRVREADDYYLGRQNPENLTKGLELLRADVERDPNDYEAWWRISRIIYYQARHAAASARLKLLDSGNEAGKKAVALAPNRPEGHYWLASNYDLTAEARGYPRGLLWVDAIRKEIVTVNRLDPDYEDAGGLRLLGRLEYRAPFFLGGDKRRSIEVLKDCLNRFPENSGAMLNLSESYIALGQKDEARKELEMILSLCENPQRAPELAEDQEEARARLSKYFQAGK